MVRSSHIKKSYNVTEQHEVPEVESTEEEQKGVEPGSFITVNLFV